MTTATSRVPPFLSPPIFLVLVSTADLAAFGVDLPAFLKLPFFLAMADRLNCVMPLESITFLLSPLAICAARVGSSRRVRTKLRRENPHPT